MADTPRTNAATAYGYDQLDAEHRALADRISQQLQLIQIIERLPEEQRKSVLTKLKDGDMVGAGKDLSGAISSGLGGGINGVASVGGGLFEQLKGKTDLGLDSGLLAGGTLALDFFTQGLPQLRDGIVARVNGNVTSVLSYIGFDDRMTPEQAKALGIAAASAYQVRAGERGEPSFGDFTKHWDTYISAAVSYVTEFFQYAVNHMFGDGTATMKGFNEILNAEFRKGDAAFVASELQALDKVAGYRITKERAATIAGTPGVEFKDKDGNAQQISGAGTQDKPAASPAQSEQGFLEQKREEFNTLSPEGKAAAAVGVGAAGYATVRSGQWALPRLWNLGESAAIGAVRHAGNAAAGFAAQTAAIAGGVVERVLPTTANDIVRLDQQSNRAQDRAEKTAASAARKEGLASDSDAFRKMVQEAREDAAKKQVDGLAEKMEKPGIRTTMRQLADRAANAARRASMRIEHGAAAWDGALQEASAGLKVDTRSDKQRVRDLEKTQAEAKAREAADVEKTQVEAEKAKAAPSPVDTPAESSFWQRMKQKIGLGPKAEPAPASSLKESPIPTRTGRASYALGKGAGMLTAGVGGAYVAGAALAHGASAAEAAIVGGEAVVDSVPGVNIGAAIVRGEDTRNAAITTNAALAAGACGIGGAVAGAGVGAVVAAPVCYTAVDESSRLIDRHWYGNKNVAPGAIESAVTGVVGYLFGQNPAPAAGTAAPQTNVPRLADSVTGGENVGSAPARSNAPLAMAGNPTTAIGAVVGQ